MSAAFRYRPLDPARKEIRLLRFVDEPANDGSIELSCTIEHVSLLELSQCTSGQQGDTDVGYSAISYAWGDTGKRAQLTVEGKTLHIPVNAYLALHYLRSRPSDTPSPDTSNKRVDKSPDPTQAYTQRFWIDSICIDQANIVEQQHQVALMRDASYLSSYHLGDTSRPTTTLRCQSVSMRLAGPIALLGSLILLSS